MKKTRPVKINPKLIEPVLVNPHFEVLSADLIDGSTIKVKIIEHVNNLPMISKKLLALVKGTPVPDEAIYLLEVKADKPMIDFFYEKEPTIEYWLV